MKEKYLMKFSNRILMTLVTLALSTTAFAGNNSGRQYISYYKIDQDRIVVFAKQSKFNDNAACKDGNATSIAVAISTKRENFKELYASVMLAHANDRQIAFWLDGACTPATAGGPFPTASMVYVY
jgi:hypothetical protein